MNSKFFIIYLRKIRNKFYKKLESLPIIDPNNKIIIIYQCVNFIAGFFLFFYVSVRWGFLYSEQTMPFFDNYKIFCITLFFFQIIANLNIGYYEMGRKIIQRKDVLENFKKSNIVYDLLVILSMVYTLIKKSNSWDCIVIDQLIYLKVFSFLRTKDILEEKIVKNNAPIYSLLQLIFLCFICSHVTGIGWHLLNQYEIATFEDKS
jgi:hypothetical protein